MNKVLVYNIYGHPFTLDVKDNMPTISSKVYNENAHLFNFVIRIEHIGKSVYRLNGLKHRENGPAAEYKDGTRMWFINGKLHREGGPAVIIPSKGNHYYYKGDLHRLDGPAVEFFDSYKEYWVYGDRYANEEEYLEAIKTMTK